MKSNEGKIFVDGHHLYPYYLSGYAMHLLQKLFASKQISSKYIVYKYHLLMLFRWLSETQGLPDLYHKKIEKYCTDLREILWDEAKALAVFQKATQLIDIAMKNSTYSSREAVRRKTLTTDLLSLVSSERRPVAATAKRDQGVVKWFSDLKGYGFITSSQGKDIFVHYTDIKCSGHRCLTAGETVEYIVIETDKGPTAREVEIVGR